MNAHLWLPRLIAGLISVLQASSLRERYYAQQQRIIILETAIQDIARINDARIAPSVLIRNIAIRTVDLESKPK